MEPNQEGRAPAMANLAYREVYTMNPTETRKLLIKAYHETKSISKTARMWKTSRNVIRKWVRPSGLGPPGRKLGRSLGRRSFQAEGEQGLKDISRRPLRSPRRTPPETEQTVLQARQTTGYGRDRLAIYLEKRGLHISPRTVRHILRRHVLTKRGPPCGGGSPSGAEPGPEAAAEPGLEGGNAHPAQFLQQSADTSSSP